MTTAFVEVVEDSHASSKSTISDIYGVPSEELSPKESKESGSDVNIDDGQLQFCHNLWRIALYYIYVEMTPSQVKSHIDVQRRACEELGLMGRVRVSHEGVNGVLSGKYEILRIYEKTITCALQQALRKEERENRSPQGAMIITDAHTNSENNSEYVDEIINLDIKYCELRAELPLQKQLFGHLIVKETKNVIGLFDQSLGQDQRRHQEKSFKSERYRRRRERKRQQQEAKRQVKIENLHKPQLHVEQFSSSTISMIPTNDEILLADNDRHDVVNKQNSPSASRPLDMSCLYRSVMEEPLKQARHLSATEWNDKLDAVASSDKSAMLLDVRNIYEMKVGHFVHPSTPTLFTNTRKYSDLPQILASNPEIQERDQIFMYCTGGVRCERVSMLVHQLYPQKEIFQLQGGIQRYLETCSEKQHQRKQQDDNSNDPVKNNPGYFVGKNFVSSD